MMSHMYMYKNTDTFEYLIYFLHEFISFKDMLSYKELNYDVYIYKSTETDYFITLFFINNYDEIWFICQLSISILKIQYEHVLLLDRFSKRSKVNSNIQNLIATTENSILFVFIKLFQFERLPKFRNFLFLCWECLFAKVSPLFTKVTRLFAKLTRN